MLLKLDGKFEKLPVISLYPKIEQLVNPVGNPVTSPVINVPAVAPEPGRYIVSNVLGNPLVPPPIVFSPVI